uniref:Uncharacterized protein n=1 Tax=Brassica campestris TaxID=3711 RepID=M4EJQ8_BRACM
MGQDYSYSQPSSSDEFDMTYLLEAEAALYADEGQSSFSVGEASFKDVNESVEKLESLFRFSSRVTGVAMHGLRLSRAVKYSKSRVLLFF